MVELFLFILALIWLIFASVSDIKTHEVPDWLSYSLIIIGFGNALIKSLILKDISFLFYSFIAFSLFFLIALLLYYTKQWGGGDVKLLIGMVTLFPIYPETLIRYFNPNLNLPFILILILNLILFGAIYSLFYGAYLLIKNKINLVKELKNYKINKIYFIVPLLILIISMVIQDISLRLLILSLSFMILIAPLLLIYIRIVENKCMLKKFPISKLTEGDWITKNIYYKGRLIYNKNSPGITNAQILLLKKTKLKNVIIKEGIPFVPAFLISFIITILFGNLFVI